MRLDTIGGLEYSPDVPGSTSLNPVSARDSVAELGQAPSPFGSVRMDGFKSIRRSDRAAALVVAMQAKQVAEKEMSSLDLAMDLAEKQQRAADEMQARMDAAYSRLARPAPVQGQTQMSRGELIAAVLGGFASGDFEGANRTGLGLAQQRNDREFAQQVSEFQSDQRMAGVDFDRAAKEFAQANERVIDLDRWKISRQQGIEEREARSAEQDRLYEKEQAATRQKYLVTRKGSLLDGLKDPKSPGQTRLAIDEFNKIQGELGEPQMDEATQSQLLKDSASRYRTEGMRRNADLLGAWGKEVDRFGGDVPDEVYQSYAEIAQHLADEYGVNPVPIVNPKSKTLRAADVLSDNERADKQLELRGEEFKWRKQFSEKGFSRDILESDREYSLKLEKWLSGDGEAPSSDEIQKQVDKIRLEQSGIKSERSAIKSRLDELSKVATIGPDSSEADLVAADAAQKEIVKLSSRLTDLELRNSKLEGMARFHADVRKDAAGVGDSKPISSSKWEPKAREIAVRYGVRPDLFARVIQAESAWNPNVRSPKGAIGLAQLMPGTAAMLGVDPNDPIANLNGGAKYLSQMLEMFGGDERLALAAYNAGPGAVRKYGGVPPFAETQAYVRKILGEAAPKSGSAPKPKLKPNSKAAAKPPAKPAPKGASKGADRLKEFGL